MFRIRWILIPLWVGCIAGVFVVAALSFGWVGWTPFIVGGLLGLILGLPAGVLTARHLRAHPEQGDGHQPTMRPDPHVRGLHPG